MAKKTREQRKLERARSGPPASTRPTASAAAPASAGPASAPTKSATAERPPLKAKAHVHVEEPDASPRRHDAEIAAARAARAAHVSAPKKKGGNPALVLAGLVALAGLIVWLAQRPSAPEPAAVQVTAESTKPAAPPEAAIPRPPVAAASVELDLMPSPREAAATKPAETKSAETKPAETKPAETKPAETKPAEAKPAETKPVVAKPAEVKPAGAKPASKPAAAPAAPPAAAPDDVY